MNNFIIVVDDSPTVRTIAEYTLKSAGYNGVSFANGLRALKWLDEHTDVQPSLVYMDVQMPGLDGYDCALYLTGQSRFQKTAIVLMSAELVEIAKLRLVGATAHMHKPFTVEKLLTTTQTYVPLPAPIVTRKGQVS
jgi:two-component system, chemotaxis family, chemotaxis protein CheY